MIYYQQGDVLLKRVESVPVGFEGLKTDILHKGQNHHHRVVGDFEIGIAGAQRYLLSKGSKVVHEEHGPIDIPAGAYRLGIVMEYDHQEEESRQVID